MEHVAFGAFNPRFYGVSMFLSDENRRGAHSRYHLQDDVAAWAKKNSSSLRQVSTLSAIEHEVRHFHDFLLAPSGTIMMGLRMQASINGFQAMKAMRDLPGRFAPAPLIRWMRWDDATRRNWIGDNEAWLGIQRPDELVSVPYTDDPSNPDRKTGLHAVPDTLPSKERFHQYALMAAQAYVTMENWRQQTFAVGDLNVTGEDICEATAHLVQIQAVWTGQGEQAARAFQRFVYTSSAKQLKPLQVLWTALGLNSKLTRATELFTWMLLGPYEKAFSTGHPANRYFQILKLALTSPGKELLTQSMPVGQLFETLDTITQSGSWKDNLLSASASADRRREMYVELAKTCRGGFFDALFEIAEKWYNDQCDVRATFRHDPESLTDPTRYISEARYPLPLVETRFGEAVHERDTALNLAHGSAITSDQDGRIVISYIGCLKSNELGQNIENVRTARIITHMIDYLFTDEPALDSYERWCRSLVANQTHKQIISVY